MMASFMITEEAEEELTANSGQRIWLTGGPSIEFWRLIMDEKKRDGEKLCFSLYLYSADGVGELSQTAKETEPLDGFAKEVKQKLASEMLPYPNIAI